MNFFSKLDVFHHFLCYFPPDIHLQLTPRYVNVLECYLSIVGVAWPHCHAGSFNLFPFFFYHHLLTFFPVLLFRYASSIGMLMVGCDIFGWLVWLGQWWIVWIARMLFNTKTHSNTHTYTKLHNYTNLHKLQM